MHVIVPLAGPDFVRADGSIKALEPFQGQPLLKYALDSRPWASKAKQYSFVLYDCQEARRFAHDYLSHWYKGCSVVYLSAFTRGAAISALSGLSVLDEFCQPLIIDLADIIYNSNINIEQVLEADQSIGGIALVFESNNPQYSYLASDSNGQVVEAAEKRVISDQASAGTYIFRNCATALKAVAHAIENESSQTHNNLFYVCPLFNGVLAQGKQVALARVFDIMDMKITSIPHG
jgi:NDP-sugar pyrophosphorylase family protein